MAIPSKLGRTDRDIAGLVGCLASYGRNADAVVQNAFFDPPAAPSSASLALSATDGADVMAGAVSVASAASMSLTVTEGADTFAGALGLRVSASMSATEGADAFIADARLVASASLVAVEGADAFASNVSLLITAQMAATEGSDLANAGLEVEASAVSLTLAAEEGADVCAASMVCESAAHVGGASYDTTPQSREEWAVALDAGRRLNRETPEPESIPEPQSIQESPNIQPLHINPALFVELDQAPVAVLGGEPFDLVSDDELAAAALVILQARANSYRRLCTGTPLPFSRAA